MWNWKSFKWRHQQRTKIKGGSLIKSSSTIITCFTLEPKIYSRKLLKDIGWGRDQTKKEKKIKVNITFMPNEEKNFKVSGTFKMCKMRLDLPNQWHDLLVFQCWLGMVLGLGLDYAVLDSPIISETCQSLIHVGPNYSTKSFQCNRRRRVPPRATW